MSMTINEMIQSSPWIEKVIAKNDVCALVHGQGKKLFFFINDIGEAKMVVLHGNDHDELVWAGRLAINGGANAYDINQLIISQETAV